MNQAFRRAFVVGCVTMFVVNVLVWWLGENVSLPTTTLIVPVIVPALILIGVYVATKVGRRTFERNETRETQHGNEAEDRRGSKV
jgi:hypothetical protein